MSEMHHDHVDIIAKFKVWGRQEERSLEDRSIKKKWFYQPDISLIFSATIVIVVGLVAMGVIWFLDYLDLVRKIAVLMVGLLYLLIIIHVIWIFIYSIVLAIRNRKGLFDFFSFPFGTLMNNTIRYSKRDILYLCYLKRFHIESLKYTYLQQQAEMEAFEKRIRLISGAIDKIGVIPGMAAFYFGGPKVFSGDEGEIAFAISIVLVFFYIVGVYGHRVISKWSRFLAVVQMAIDEKEILQKA